MDVPSEAQESSNRLQEDPLHSWSWENAVPFLIALISLGVAGLMVRSQIQHNAEIETHIHAEWLTHQYDPEAFASPHRGAGSIADLLGVGSVVALGFAMAFLFRSSRNRLRDKALHLEQQELSQAILQEEQEKLLAILSNSGEYVSAMDEDYNIIFMSGPLIEKFGDSTGAKCYTAFCGLNEPCGVNCAVDEVIKENRDIYRYTHSSVGDAAGGRVPWSATNDNPPQVLDTVARPFVYRKKRCVLEVSRDVTKRHRTEQAIRNIVQGGSNASGEEFFESMVKQLSDSLQADCTMIGEITDADAPTVRTLAICYRGEIVENLEYSLAGTPSEQVLDRDVCSYSSGVSNIFPGDATLDDLDVDGYVGVRLVSSSGQPLGVMAALFSNPLQDVEFLESILQLFASRTAMEIERQRIQVDLERLATAVSQTHDTIVITDPDGVVLYANPALEETTGFALDEVIGQNIRMLKSQEHDDAHYRELWDTISQGGVWSGRFINTKKDGSLYEEEASISPIVDDSGRITNYVAVKRDVSREVDLETQLRQAQKMEAVGQLAGGIAHDFNNLLQAILGYTDMAMMRLPPDSKQYAELEHVMSAGQRAATLTRQLLAFSRRQTLQLEYVNLNQVVNGITRILQRVIREDIELELNLARELATVHADRGMMEQVLMNLCVNARDAIAGAGKITIHTENTIIDDSYCSNHPWASPGPCVRLSVSDTGSGMPQEVVEQVFEPFFTTKEVGEGTGLGLSMVYGITKQHEGLIDCESEPGRGTSFIIHLPIAGSGAALEVDEEADRHLERGTETILLAEDDAVVRGITAAVLENSGYTVLTAADGDEVVSVFEVNADRISLAILDVVMPILSGPQAYAHIKRVNPDIRVLFSTGYSPESMGESLTLDERLQVIRKPYIPADLLRAVRGILDGRDLVHGSFNLAVGAPSSS